MSGFKKKSPADELIESLLKDVGGDSNDESEASESTDEYDIKTKEEEEDSEFSGLLVKHEGKGFQMVTGDTNFDANTASEYENTRKTDPGSKEAGTVQFTGTLPNIPQAMGEMVAQNLKNKKNKKGDLTELKAPTESMATSPIINEPKPTEMSIPDFPQRKETPSYGDSEKTVAVAGYQVRSEANFEDRVKVSVGQNRTSSSGYANWNSGGSAESNLAQADNLRIAQEKIIELETENEKLRLQNEELMAASEIIKERSDLLSAQLSEYKNDRDGLEDSFKNEIVLLKNHLAKKDNELQKSVLKTDELESRLKFDMKKIRVRERELENRLELIRAEKNAVVKNKDEQILDLRRKMDVLQMEVESYRQKCVELNKSIETSQESFKRTTRALRLAMANLELQEENKVPMKKAD